MLPNTLLNNTSNGLSPTAQATLLLTSHFSKASNEAVKPLTNTEWGRFALWLKEKSITPADLLTEDPQELLQGWQDKTIDIERILALLKRGHSLALAMEKWQRAGLWVLTRSDSEYPRSLKQHLHTSSPPVLFGCGNKALLSEGGLAVIGSRKANASDLDFSYKVGEKAAEQGITIISGGARGVDETVMLGALEHGGKAVGVLADSLLRVAMSSKWRQGLMDGRAVLLSPFYPEAGFNVGNAMARNRYIYCLAHSSLVVHSGKKGGTLSGAEENLQKAWVPLWVKPTEDKDAANADLVAKGGCWLDIAIDSLDIADLIHHDDNHRCNKNGQIDDLFTPAQTELFAEVQPILDVELRFDETSHQASAESDQLATIKAITEDQSLEETGDRDENGFKPTDFYQLFISELQRLISTPVTVDQLVVMLNLHKSQINDWLKRAVEEDRVKKLNRPVRYQVKNHQ